MFDAPSVRMIGGLVLAAAESCRRPLGRWSFPHRTRSISVGKREQTLAARRMPCTFDALPPPPPIDPSKSLTAESPLISTLSPSPTDHRHCRFHIVLAVASAIVARAATEAAETPEVRDFV